TRPLGWISCRGPPLTLGTPQTPRGRVLRSSRRAAVPRGDVPWPLRGTLPGSRLRGRSSLEPTAPPARSPAAPSHRPQRGRSETRHVVEGQARGGLCGRPRTCHEEPTVRRAQRAVKWDCSDILINDRAVPPKIRSFSAAEKSIPSIELTAFSIDPSRWG